MAEIIKALTWDDMGNKLYEIGTDRGVLYPQDTDGSYPKGVAWNGLRGVTESPSGAEATKLYANNGNYCTLYSAEEMAATITAYTYPTEFEACDGSASVANGVTIGQQTRKAFGLSYRTLVGNDTEGQDHGYKIHLLYGAKASPSEKGYTTISDSPEAIEFSWETTTTPVPVTNNQPTSTLVIDSLKISAVALKSIEDILYGSGPVKLMEQPSDWAENYANYFKLDSTGQYIALTSAEEFDGDTFYKNGVAGRLPLPDEIIEIVLSAEEA